jgi:hypothetical protein
MTTKDDIILSLKSRVHQTTVQFEAMRVTFYHLIKELEEIEKLYDIKVEDVDNGDRA